MFGRIGLVIMMSGAVAACSPTVQVQAPSEPIHLKIDLNIKHELAVQIEREVGPASVSPAIPLAKRAGWLGERYDGYLGIVPSDKTPGDMKGLALSANEERRQKYDALAKKHDLTLAYIEKVAGARFLEQSKPGEFILAAQATPWSRKTVN